ncbi:hypothetical protein BGX21_011415 [Mortierella sp. AD011]|nr:hypothetical protein BGX20_006971 [Mortierella sp. AD010]KAF9402056.1 hypothetical protein BGX21_011415 [Mortierella sp. AD011]
MSPLAGRMALRSLSFTTKHGASSARLMATRVHPNYQESLYISTVATRSMTNPRNIFNPSRAINSFPSVVSHARIASITTTTSCFHTSTAIMNDQSAEAGQKRPATRPCWKCSTPVPYMGLLCSNPECRVVQTLAPGANYFEVLGLSPEPSFDVDTKDLRNKFFKIQQLIHPDSYAHNTNGDQVYAQQQSSLANKAYSTLKEPLSRANYILDLLGSPIHESETLSDPELLMEVMEARELLEDAQTEEEVEELKSVNDGRISETIDGLSMAFKEHDLETAKTLAIKLQYWVRIKNVIRDWAAGKPIVADHV